MPNYRHHILAKEHTTYKKFVTEQLAKRRIYKRCYQKLINRKERTVEEERFIEYYAQQLSDIRENLKWANRKILLCKMDIKAEMQQYSKFKKAFNL